MFTLELGDQQRTKCRGAFYVTATRRCVSHAAEDGSIGGSVSRNRSRSSRRMITNFPQRLALRRPSQTAWRMNQLLTPAYRAACTIRRPRGHNEDSAPAGVGDCWCVPSIDFFELCQRIPVL